jgi:WD40 repeat protein
MDLEQALAIANQAVYTQIGRYMSDVEQLIFIGSWKGQTYELIAEINGYSVKYLKDDSGRKFWKLLSQVLGETVSKNNFRAAIERLSQREKQQTSSEQSQPRDVGVVTQLRPSSIQADWGEVIDVSQFYGRSAELTTLMQWITTDRCRLIALLGMGGIGKTALSVKLANQLLITSSIQERNEFEFVIWRSLRNAPPLDHLLANLVPFLSNQQNTQNTLDRFIYYLRSHRCLVILDNMETILQGSERAGQFRVGYEDYGELLRMVSESNHQSCVVLTSREKPAEVAAFEGVDFKVRSLQLGGSQQAAQAILQAKGLVGSTEQRQQLCDRYSNSPLAIKIVSTSIQDLFEGDIDEFLKQDTAIFNGIRRLLDQQFDRLSPLEQTIMCWLAINREWTTIAELHEDIIPVVSKAKLLESLESLNWRSLIEKRTGSYTQQPVVMEYVTERFTEQVANELITKEFSLLLTHALIKTTVKDYVRESQARLIAQPIAEQLNRTFGSSSNLKSYLQPLIEQLRTPNFKTSGYGAGNLINLCVHLQFDLTDYDFSNLVIWHGYLQRSTLHRVNFAHTEFAKSIFTQTFGEILSISFSPDATHLVTGDPYGEIRMWRVADGQLVWSIRGHTSWIWSVMWSPDGAMVASGSDDHTVKIWNADTGRLCCALEGHRSSVRSVAWNPIVPSGSNLTPEAQMETRALIASSGVDQTIRIWNIHTGQTWQSLKGHSGCIWSVTWSPDGTMVASGSDDHTVKIWDVATGQLLKTLEGHCSSVRSVNWSPDGAMIASSTDAHTVKVWDVRTGQLLKTLEGRASVSSMNRSSDGTITAGRVGVSYARLGFSINWSPDDAMIASSSEDGTIKIWNVSTGKLLKTLQGHMGSIWSVAWSAVLTTDWQENNIIIASSGADQTVRLWNAFTGKLLMTLKGSNNSVRCASWNSISKSAKQNCSTSIGYNLVSGTNDRIVRLWRIDIDEEMILRELSGHTHWILSAAWSSDGAMVASSSADQTIKLWNIATETPLKTLRGHSNWSWSIAWNMDGTLLVSGSDDQSVKLWDVQTGNVLKSFQGHADWVRAVTWSPDGTMVASGSYDHSVKIWDVQTGQILKTLDEHNNAVRSVAWSPDGTMIASASYDNSIKIWDVQTGEVLKTLNGHTSWVRTVTWSPDGSLIASGSYDNSIKIWDVQTGQVLKTLNGHTSWVFSTEFATGIGPTDHSANQVLMSSSADETIRLWNLQTGECLRTLRIPRPYEGMNITGVTGITEAQKETLKALGAIEQMSRRTALNT